MGEPGRAFAGLCRSLTVEGAIAGSGVVLFGTDSPFSVAVLRTLLGEGVKVLLIAVPGPAPAASPLPVMVPGRSETVISVAAVRYIPVYYVPDLVWERTVAAIRERRPDFLLVACFPARLPTTVCEIPTKDALNLHPSLLPRYRGPTPLFWQLRAAERNTGVSLHRLSQRFDSGDIIAQARETWPDGSRASEIDERLAVRGARLFVETMADYARNNVVPRPQDNSASSYFRSPVEEDFRVSTDWAARRVFNFMRGTEAYGRSYPVRLPDTDWRLRQALGHSADGQLGSEFEVQGGEIRIQCRPGVLHATFDSRAESP